jgi:hypothetical protein
MNNFVLCLLIIIAILSVYYIFFKDQDGNSTKKVNIVNEIKAIDYDKYTKNYCKDKGEYDSMIDFINTKTLAKNNDEKGLKEYLSF